MNWFYFVVVEWILVNYSFCELFCLGFFEDKKYLLCYSFILSYGFLECCLSNEFKKRKKFLGREIKCFYWCVSGLDGFARLGFIIIFFYVLVFWFLRISKVYLCRRGVVG